MTRISELKSRINAEMQNENSALSLARLHVDLADLYVKSVTGSDKTLVTEELGSLRTVYTCFDVMVNARKSKNFVTHLQKKDLRSDKGDLANELMDIDEAAAQILYAQIKVTKTCIAEYQERLQALIDSRELDCNSAEAVRLARDEIAVAAALVGSVTLNDVLGIQPKVRYA